MPTPELLAGLVADAAPLLAGARVEKVQAASGDRIVLTLRRRGEPKRCLVVGLERHAATFHLAATKPPVIAPPPESCIALRRRLERSVIERVSSAGDGTEVHFVLSGDRSLRCAFGRGAASLELNDSEGMQLTVASGFTVAGGVVVELETAAAPEEGDADSVPASHRGEAERFRARHEDAALGVVRARTGRVLRLVAKRQRRLVVNIRRDLEKAGDADEHRRRGELLKATLGRLKRGVSSIDVVDWYDPDGGTVTIALDPLLAPTENVERCFRRYRKAKRTREVATQRLARAERDGAAVERLAARFEAADDLDELAAVEAEIERLYPGAVAKAGAAAKAGASAKGPRQARALGPRRFVSRDGLEILVARSSTGNDELTFRIANGNDLFLHVAGRPGAHVVVRLPGARPVPEETLLDAAHLAVWFSVRREARAAEGEGFSADVDYAPIKHVRRARGAGPGKVLLASRRTIHVRVEPARLRRLTRGGEPAADGS